MATVSVPNSFTNGTTADADEVNQNFNALKDFANNSTVHVDGSQAFTSSVDAGSNKVINVTAPTSGTDAANKTYVDDAIDTDVATHAALTSSVHGISTFGATLVDDASASAARSTLGLGSMATQASSGVAITGGSITGITDLALTDGGTGASSASGARTNLGLGSLAIQNTINESDIDNDAVTAGKIDMQTGSTYKTSSSTVTTSAATALTTNVTCAVNSIAIITAEVDVSWSGSAGSIGDTFVGELRLNGSNQNGEIILKTCGGSRLTASRTWIVVMPAMSSNAIDLRVAKSGSSSTVTLNGNATVGDSHTRLEYVIFNA